MLRIQDCPFDSHSPCESHFVEDDSEVSAFVGVEGSWDVFPNSEPWIVPSCCIAHLPYDSYCFVKKSRTRTGKSCSLAGDGKILTRRTEIDRIHRLENFSVDVSYVIVLRNVGPMPAKNFLALLVPLDLPSASPAGGFESEIEATDAGEKTAECQVQNGSLPSKVS